MRVTFAAIVAAFVAVNSGPAEPPALIDSVAPDLVVPALEAGPPHPGKRVRQALPNWDGDNVYHVLYLPPGHDPTRSYPVIVEYAGNGNYRNALGDVSTGLPEGSKLGFGVSGGQDVIWVCLPYLNGDGTRIAIRWWGDPPQFDVKPTVDYCKAAVPWICETYGGDRRRVVLAGFSRGAIACNYIGLHDDEIAQLWCGFIVYSHYDGVKSWPYPGSDRDSAMVRLNRLQGRPQFICAESALGIGATRDWLESTAVAGDFTFQPTGFRNHNDAWVLRPSPARTALREWFARIQRR